MSKRTLALMTTMAAIVLTGVSSPLHAAPGTSGRATAIDECISAHEQAQVLVKQSKLHDAKERMRICMNEACPAVARKDCTTWLDDLERTEPTVIVVARDSAGHDLIKVRVLVDGAQVATGIDGKPLPLDPGPHTIRLEATDGRAVSFDAVVIQGDRNRPLVGTFEDAKPEPPPIPPPSPTKKIIAPDPQEKPRENDRSSGLPAISYVLGGVSLAGFASFGTFAVIGKGQEGCVPNCQKSEIDDFRRSYLIADVSLGIGIVALAGAVWFALRK